MGAVVLNKRLLPTVWQHLVGGHPLLKSLHIQQRVKFKTLVYKALNGLAPQYISDILTTYRSSEGAFIYSCLVLWNKLSDDLRAVTAASIFKRNLKTCVGLICVCVFFADVVSTFCGVIIYFTAFPGGLNYTFIFSCHRVFGGVFP